MLSPHVPDLDALELLLTIARTGSLGRAAGERGVGQPAVSARVQTMERLVGLPLLERGPTGSRLTPAGALVAGWARDVVLAADRLDTGIASLRGRRDARLVVAASLTVAEHLLPGWLTRLHERRPGTSVSLSAVNSAMVAELVLAGEAELGFVEGPVVPTGLGARLVSRDRLLLVAVAGSPLGRRRRPVGAAELAALPLVEREPRSGTRAALQAALAAALGGVPQRPAPVLELSSTTAVRAAVMAGAGPAVLSALAVADDLAAGRLRAVPTEGVDLARDLRAVWARGTRPAGPARDLVALAVAART